MARMYPPQLFSDVKSPGEVEVFRRLRDDPFTDNWIVFHSLDIVQHRSQVAGEIDFIIIVPAKGVLCLEVKGAKSIRRENGLWYYGSNPNPDPKGPFKQSNEAMHSLRTNLAKIDSRLKEVLFWHAVLFPYVDFSATSEEWHSWQVVGSHQFLRKSIGQIVLDILDKAREYMANNTSWFDPGANQPSSTLCDLMVSTLRPDFEFFEPPDSKSKRREQELKTYTEEQLDALDAMENNYRVIFSGPAGTGKTLLAIEAARRAQATGRHVLFLCFNRLVGSWLKQKTANLGSGVTAMTLHSYMLSLAKIPVPPDAKSDFWERELPIKATDALLGADGASYDEVVIDEAQDIMRDLYLDVLDLSLKGGLAAGRWRLFGDFEGQAIYTGDEANVILDRRFGNTVRYSLRVNCRNTPRISTFACLLGGLDPDYSRVRRPDNGIEPDIKIYQDALEQRRLLYSTLDKLRSEGFEREDIVILSTRDNSACIASTIEGKWKSRLTSLETTTRSGKVRYGSIHSFKGLEAPAIVVTDIEEARSRLSTSLFYIAITRALDRLVILAGEKARQEMLEILSNSKEGA